MTEASPSRPNVRLAGAIDMHVHFGPEPLIEPLSGVSHSVDPVEAAQEAAELGMSAVVLKAHEFSSTMTAYMAQRAVDDRVRVIGGICCDHPVGGLNPYAVETALKSGAKVVWLPTVSSVVTDPSIIETLFGTTKSIPVIDDDGDLLPEAREILALVGEYDAVLATGHTSTAEHFAVARAHRGKLLVTHAMQAGFGPELSAQECRELADLGAFIEFTAHSCMGTPATVSAVAGAIDKVGIEKVVLASDYGWSDALPHPGEGFKSYLDALWTEGASEPQLREMVCQGPARLLDLDV